MKRNIKKRKSKLALDLSVSKNYKARKLGGENSSQTVTGNPIQNSNIYKYSELNIPYDRVSMLNRIKPFYKTDEAGNIIKDNNGEAIPNTLGMLLKKQLQPLNNIKDQNYYTTENASSGNFNRGEQPSSADAKQFLLNWYNSPKTIEIIKEEAKKYNTNVFQDIPYTDENGNIKFYSLTPEETVLLRSKLASEVPEFKDVQMQDNTLAYYKPTSSLTKAPTLNDNIFNIVQDADGNTRYLGPSIQYGNNESEYSGSWVPLHEINHAFQHQLLPSYFNDLNIGHEHDDLKSEKHSYLMALRASLGLNPEKRDYTEEDAQQMIKSLQNVDSGSAGPNKLLEIINNDAKTLAHMLNTWAFAPNKEDLKDELTLKYADGGVLNKIAGIGSAAIGIAESAMSNAEVDTSSATNAIEATQNHKLDTNSLDALAASYSTTPWASENLNFKDLRPSTGELIMNTAKAGIQGLSAGASLGGGWGAIAGAAVGLGSAIGGMFAGRAKAKKEEARLENEAKIANMSLQAQAESNRDLIMQQQANSALRNLAAEGGQLDTYKEGEEYDLSAEEIKNLKSKGYDIDLNYSLNEEVDVDPSDIQTLRELGYEFDII